MLDIKEYKKLTISQDANGIRTFDDINLQKAIDGALSKLSSDKHFAVVAHGEYGNGKGSVSLTAVTKIGTDWSIAVACYKPATGSFKDLSAGAELVWTP